MLQLFLLFTKLGLLICFIGGVLILGSPVQTLILFSITSLFHNYPSDVYIQPTVLAFLAINAMPLTIDFLKSNSTFWNLLNLFNFKNETLNEIHKFVEGTLNTLSLNSFLVMIEFSVIIGVLFLLVAGFLMRILELKKKSS
jgi:hypothetical protein